MKGRENNYWKNANRYSSLFMNRILYWNWIHSNRWTEPKPTCCCWWKSSHWKKWNKQPKNPTKRFSLTRQRKKRTNGIRTQNQILSLRARKKGRSFLDREIFTQKYLQKSEWISPFPKRNRQRRQKSTDGSRKCHIMTAQKHGIDDIGFIHSYIFESVSSLRS